MVRGVPLMGSALLYIPTVEPPIKDTPNKGHLSIRDTRFNPVLILSCNIEPLNKGHLCIKRSQHVLYTEVPLYMHSSLTTGAV